MSATPIKRNMDNLQDKKELELISLYGKVVKELQDRQIIRTKNIVGDLGERFAIDYYTQSSRLENLSAEKASNKDIDATGEKGNRYAIKSITRNVTGVFHGLPKKNSNAEPKQLFDLLLIVKFSDSYEVETIYELTWQQFLKHKRWHSRMKAWNVSVNKEMKADAKIVYPEKGS
jgi:hypothetical protein